MYNVIVSRVNETFSSIYIERGGVDYKYLRYIKLLLLNNKNYIIVAKSFSYGNETRHQDELIDKIGIIAIIIIISRYLMRLFYLCLIKILITMFGKNKRLYSCWISLI